MDPKEVQRIVTERNGQISEELAAQFDNLFHVLSMTIKRLSWKQWVSGETPSRTPAQIACHIIDPCEVYATGIYDGCRKRFGIDVASMEEELTPDQLPTPQEVVVYAQDVRQIVRNWLDDLSNETLLGPTPSPGWAQRGITYLGRIIYILRHGTYHMGMLRAELDSRGIKHGGVFK